jgi:hypothetical protein
MSDKKKKSHLQKKAKMSDELNQLSHTTVGDQALLSNQSEVNDSFR